MGMPTTKARINMSISDDVRTILRKVAKRDHMPEATKAAQLLEIGLALEEDQVWDEITERRDKKRARFTPHLQAWK